MIYEPDHIIVLDPALLEVIDVTTGLKRNGWIIINSDKEPSEFPWSYDVKETCLILEGKATVISADGLEISFAAGDLVTFEAGLECTWKIKETISKRYSFG